jgi:DNA-binding beta-propeller fold protein YncE
MNAIKKTALFTLLLIVCQLSAQSVDEISKNRLILPNGWGLSPVGKTLTLGDLPLNIAVSHSQKLLAITNNGQSTQSIMLIDVIKQTVIDSIVIGKSWLGLTFSANDKFLYASGGNDNCIVKYSINNEKLSAVDTLVLGKPWPVRISVAGIAVDDAKNILYAVTKDDNALYVYDLKNKRIISRNTLGGEGYTCLLSPNKDELYITCWGCNRVKIWNTTQMEFSPDIVVGSNPNDLCITKNGKYMFVANANDNSVSVINIKKRLVIETLNAALFPNSLAGSTTNSVALSPDDKKLFIANADNNCLAVFDVSEPSESVSKGFIPTDWYPTCVRTIGKKIFISNGKGNMSMANPFGPNPYGRDEEVTYQHGITEKAKPVQYIGGLFKGNLQIVDSPTNKQLASCTESVYKNTPNSHGQDIKIPENNPIPHQQNASSSIKYVFYIVKENRTYDQVLGDMPEGNGDKNLVLFGEQVTPNQHALAREFVLLDNFYVNGEVSADGHNWSLGGYATDYLEKTWPTSYGGRGGDYDAEGNRKVANNKDGFIWDFCKRQGVSYRTYGEFADDYKPNIPVLKDHFCSFYTSWDQHVRDTIRFTQWRKDFDSLLVHQSLPRLNTLRFINDHTEGLNKGRPTPRAHVADNDLAVGMFVDYLSHSSIWNESAVFIVEDDAQNGPDHVDAHRSTAYLAGGFVKEGFVDHTMYSTASMLHTMELILGLPPMSQYDAAAEPMWRCFDSIPKHKPFRVKPHQIDLNEINKNTSKYADLSQQLDFSKEDEAPDGLFNEIIWKAVKGIDSKCPATVHAAFYINRQF